MENFHGPVHGKFIVFFYFAETVPIAAIVPYFLLTIIISTISAMSSHPPSPAESAIE
jgi:hypothetical protein